MIASLTRWFLTLFPPHWWESDAYRSKPDIWDVAHAASPLWFMMSTAFLAISVVGMWGLSLLGAMVHVLIAVGYMAGTVRLLAEHGFDWPLAQLPVAHAVWINLLFAGLHWMNIDRNADKLPKTAPHDETGSP